MLQRLWLLFAQFVTVLLAVLFVVSTLRPEWVRLPQLSNTPGKSETSTVIGAPQQSSVAPQVSAAPLTRGEGVVSYADAVKRSLPAVVSIATSRVDRRAHPFADDPIFQQLFGKRRTPQKQAVGEGSGAIASAQGHVLTNFHVIQGATDIEVMLGDGRVLPAKVLGADPESDLAVLKVDAPNLPVIPFGDSDALQVGDVVLAMGNPFGISNTVTMGIVSALARKKVSEINQGEEFIQTDAAINPGNSGGPLVNAAGQLVGINTAIYTQTGSTAGIGFSIPAALVKSTMEQIIATGTVARGYLGVSMADFNDTIVRTLSIPQGLKGALVAAVVNDEPAARGGIRAEDILVEIGGKPVADRADAIALIAGAKPDSVVPIKLWRRGETIMVSVKLGKRSPIVQR